MSFYGNKIESIEEGAFQGLTNVRELDLRNNNLRAIAPNAFKGLHSLGVLTLSNNPLIKVEAGAFKELGNLYSLEISNVPLEGLPKNVFYDTPELRNLFLFRTSIPEVSVLFHSIPEKARVYGVSVDGSPILTFPIIRH
tara:strand:+ start:4078 stop:4494 length:417 start_codon:yes stop_codon:yes gene_type:complete